MLDALDVYAPGIRDSVMAVDALGPLELEEVFGLPSGDIFHGALTPEQSFGGRFPHRTPVGGLYLCGSGSSPGGGVMGAAGQHAARILLAD